jgi:hypothetical protein
MSSAFPSQSLVFIGWLAICLPAFAEPPAPRSSLYTHPDPASAGGITGHVTNPATAIEQVLAIPFDAPEKVYEGMIEGDDKRSFRFTGLPMRKYDLVIVYANSFYEGLQLERGPNTLTNEDHKKIEAIIQKSEPYFTNKFLHRLEGTTGRGNEARSICTFLRAHGSEFALGTYQGKSSRDDFRRTMKLVILKDVGPGWQVVRTRDLYPVWISPKNTEFKHNFSETLSRVRVADTLKNLGDLDLSK